MEDYPWYNSEKDFEANFRKMSTNQLIKHYNKSDVIIRSYAKKLKLNKFDIIKNLSQEEIIFMYESLLKNEIKVFTNGMYNYDKYIIILIKYMVNNILKWNRDDICEYFSSKTLQDNGLGGLLGIKKFKIYDYLSRTFHEYNIMPWELKSSSVGNGFWTEENSKNAFSWLKIKLLKDKNINNINIAGVWGFKNLLEEYNLMGLCSVRFSGNYVAMFENIYDDLFSKEEMLKHNYTFNINTVSVPKLLKGVIYELTDSYNQLDDKGKTLINDIIRFCENEKRFPEEKELNTQKGYISRSQFYKYFNSNSINPIYNFIQPIYNFSKETKTNKLKFNQRTYKVIVKKPEKIGCIKCAEIKEFNISNFSRSDKQKFGLKYICRTCENKHALKKHYKKLGISFDKDPSDISLIQWWEYLYKRKIKIMPNFCYIEENLIIIIKHVINNILKLHKKDEICNFKKFGRSQMEKYRIEMPCYKLGGKVKLLQKCFPEMNITEDDVFPEIYTDEDVDNIISQWIDENNLTVMCLFNKGLTYKFSNKMHAMMAAKFKKTKMSKMDMIIWYLKRNNIKHPVHKNNVTYLDFEEMPRGFWEEIQNRITRVKYYCEVECQENILGFIDNTIKLKDWICKYFRQEDFAKLFNYNYNGFHLYDILVEAYPQIKDNKILFEWEWHQYIKNDRNSLVKMLKEFILYRANNIIIDIQKDIPKYLNRIFLSKLYPKFNKQLSKGRFDSYYEWACLAFPEHASYWMPYMFDNMVAYDGVKCGSKQEMLVYEFIKRDLNMQYLKNIGQNKTGKYTYELGEEYEFERFCPDFIIEYISYKNEKTRLIKPIVIEYYGMYNENNKYYIYQNYVYKAKIKNSFYTSRDDIIFVALYPEDLKNNCEGVARKLNAVVHNLKNCA